MSGPASRFVCSGCNRTLPADDPRPWRCPSASLDDDTDHVLVRELGPEGEAELPFDGEVGEGDGWAQPFVRFRGLLHSWRFARRAGMSDASWVELALELDRRVAQVAGRGFRATPLRQERRLAAALGREEHPPLWVKDETENVAGSHKARHLFNVALHLAALERLGIEKRPAPLAIASCGNAALAAAVVARALERPLMVFVPEWADPRIVERLESFGADVTACPRRPGEPPGDPCLARLRIAVRQGAVPFTVQGSENGLAIEGGATLGWEIQRALEDSDAQPLGALFVQVGGGALASSLVLAWRDLAAWRARRAGRTEDPTWSGPRIFPVQVEGGHPLVRAWRNLARGALMRSGLTVPAGDAAIARALERLAGAPPIEAELDHAALHRSEYMWPWEVEPKSQASGILDDETYDWLLALRGTLASGGLPVVVGEETLEDALRLARHATGSPVSATGAAGLAGLVAMQRIGAAPRGPTAVLFTGASSAQGAWRDS